MNYYYNKILVPYDSSKPSENALSEATKIAMMPRNYTRDGNSQIILLHVIQEMPIPASFSVFGTGHSKVVSSKTGHKITVREHMKELSQELKVDAIKMLNDKIAAYYNTKQERQFDIKAKVSIGDTAQKIIEFADEEQVDLIVMGTSGLAGFLKIKALGSVARKVSERVKCPVMLVR